MKRGTVIGAVVLVGAIALVMAQRLGEPGAEQPVPAAGLVAQADRDPAAAGAAVPEAALAAAGEVRVYTVDPSATEIHWRIYRAGAAARLGHNHVISVGELEGSVSLTSDLADAEWELSFPVDGLIVDDSEIRARYGEGFESVPSEDDKAGTRTNMLTDRVLNGAVFPQIRLVGTGVSGPLDDARLPVAIEMLGRESEQSFPAVIVVEADSLTVTGEHRLTHEDLGLTPFTAFGGIIMAVGDEIDFTYRIHAIAGGR
ncbi:MAG TPA: hypothetical protein VMR74_06555 [Gammaproteobacteria bacterium]|nr:hypothetical protein [Gammaproteobacteria bacterium]